MCRTINGRLNMCLSNVFIPHMNANNTRIFSIENDDRLWLHSYKSISNLFLQKTPTCGHTIALFVKTCLFLLLWLGVVFPCTSIEMKGTYIEASGAHLYA